MTRRAGLVSPDVISRDMARARRAASDLAALSWVIQEAYEALYEAAHSEFSIPTQSESNGLAPGKKRWQKSDPTGDVAVSGLHMALRRHVRRTASELRKATKPLEIAESMIEEAGAELDPSMKEKFKRLREIEAAIAAEA